MLVLIVEDNKRMAEFLRKGLQEQGFSTDVVGNGHDAAAMGATGAYDVIVLDIMLPGQSGLGVIRELRARGIETPILCLTARDALQDKVAGLDLGADDYMTKPFEFLELVARVRALTRRPREMADKTLRCGDLELDPIARTVKRGAANLDLTPKEFSLLEFLMRREGSVVTRSAIVQNVWGLNFDSLSNVVEVFMSRLRAKVDQPFESMLIHTVRGVGYCLSAGEAPR